MEDKHSLFEQFEKLPRRIFLDSNILQNLQFYGEYIWDNVEISQNNKIIMSANRFKNIEALHNIFFVNQRANFEFALSENSLKEVIEKGNHHYLQWAIDVLEHWMSFIRAYENSEAFSGKGKEILQKIKSKQFCYLSKKDKILIFDAIKLECNAFLTMDLKLWKNSKHIQKVLKIKVIQPFEYWNLLEPFASLYI